MIEPVSPAITDTTLPGRLLTIFAVVELGIGTYGFMSAQLIEAVELALAGGGCEFTALASFFILGVPTILMGATLPSHAAHGNATDHHVGSAVGMLSYANTLGATVGAVLAGFVLLQEYGLAGSVGAGRRPSSVWRRLSTGWRSNMRGLAQRITTRTCLRMSAL